MNHHERISRIYNGEPTDRPGFWIGQPHEETAKKLFMWYGVSDEESLKRAINDDCRWYPGDWNAAYRHPEGRPIFDPLFGIPRTSHGQPGCFADCTDTADVEKHPWPNAEYLDFAPIKEKTDSTSDCFQFGGMWSCFWHIAAEYFGMEDYFTKMYTDPDVVHAVTRKIVDFYLEANKRIFNEIPEAVDAFFFGNDFGTQEDLLVSPDKFTEFVLPYFKELIDLAKSYSKPTQLHSCGAIAKVIPWLIDAGIVALHPLQAKARGMDAETLAAHFKGQIVFVGGVDTQELMWRGTPQQIKDEVNRLRRIFGERWIISPSHEVLMPETPVENVVALVEVATGT